ncbi:MULTISPECIES: sugar ABC transporter ATP-binding protein [unclassified Shinella]|uniref:sugar ABC transporter ATP-binding protein n=1 Tax=unclassified Shinella TaxID=2643062 RepID=UPI00234F37D0|nr:MULTISPECIES: sugar ABC transporter ATP-binding protein [unclassified Shinella]MCO5149263.1 sugar ABC transporter ATP-binding protein [Shinella sp.]MDC7265317.1 sugar ABC transporter ATP-binding protein [Shinella sp. HY16]MDC7272214.1 sugar ABC transporter ATP-binding protein [Shinella sp. YZ44]
MLSRFQVEWGSKIKSLAHPQFSDAAHKLVNDIMKRPHTPDLSGTETLIRVRGLSKRFGATIALNDVSIDLMPGEVLCLLGENGAGKSTLGKILAGLFSADNGEIALRGRPVVFSSISDARAHGVAMVFQELSLAPHLTVLENILLGTEKKGAFDLIRSKREREQVAAVFEKYGVSIPLNSPVGELPVAQQQLVETLKALAQDPAVLVLDEPTAMLGIHEKESLFRIVRQARQDGIAIVFVTHHIDEVVELGDRISLLKDGKLLETFSSHDLLDSDQIVAKLSGGNLETQAKREVARTEPVLALSGLRDVNNASFEITIHRGEVVGLYGVVGCGREDIAEAIIGLKRTGTLRMTLEGRPYRPTSPAAALKRGVAYLPSGRAANLILPTRSIRENLTISGLRRFVSRGVLSLRREVSWAVEQLREFATKFHHHGHEILSLSGGNQQKVMLARVLSNDVHLAVLEDPTAGVDIETKYQIHKILSERSERDGLSILLVSSDLLETISLCDTIYAVYGGRVAGRWQQPTRANEGAIVKAILGSGSGETAIADAPTAAIS